MRLVSKQLTAAGTALVTGYTLTVDKGFSHESVDQKGFLSQTGLSNLRVTVQSSGNPLA